VTARDEEALERLLDRLDELDRRHDTAALEREVARGRTRFPESIDLIEWEAMLAGAADDPARALALLETVLGRAPRRFWPRRERAAALIELGRFEEALAALDDLVAAARLREPEERASLEHDRGLCFDRIGRPEDADHAFARAARLAPREFFVPLRLSAEEFDALVERALDHIPRRFASYLQQTVVTVDDYPPAGDTDAFVLGVYHGVPRPLRGVAGKDDLDTIVVYKRSHEVSCADRAKLEDEVMRTVLHEIAHHFGIEHDMGDCQ
jgi:predicted Zn-dependent protease with MMP-like domain/predicted Zn-dependent protease